MDSVNKRVATALIILRLGVFIVMLMWTLDKLLNVQHAAGVFSNFYGLGGIEATAMRMLGLAELALIVAFLAGYKKRFTYGAVLALHAVSTVSSYRQYLDPFSNLLFFAAWPMLAACIALYMLRDLDTIATIDKPRPATP
jgi:hypothetical protein